MKPRYRIYFNTGESFWIPVISDFICTQPDGNNIIVRRINFSIEDC